jgi:hypothetical protein
MHFEPEKPTNRLLCTSARLERELKHTAGRSRDQLQEAQVSYRFWGGPLVTVCTLGCATELRRRFAMILKSLGLPRSVGALW